jgi:lipopolysaccharide/colanic/teichoic acid biosynthesis glycosyltransferase
MIIRIMDIVISFIGLLGLIIMFPFVALLIKLDSRGPVFYLCDRVGLNGQVFKMYKFRTMHETIDSPGPSVSPWGDPRVSAVGRVLRRLKLNEFPQFLNVFKGEMTLVGPRPEAPDLAAAYPEAAKIIFTVKPGLAGPNQIFGRNEEELYPPGADPVKFYIEHILPKKIPLDLEYIKDRSSLKNFKYLYLAVKVTLTGAISRQHLWENRSQIYLMLADLTACILSFSLAHLLRYEYIVDRSGLHFHAFAKLLPWAVLVRLPIFTYFGFYHTLIRHLSIYDFKRIFKGVALSSIILITVSFISGLTMGKPPTGAYSRSVFLIDWFCLTIMLVSMRALLKKLYLSYNRNEVIQGQKHAIIWGAGDAGELCLFYQKKCQNNAYNIVGFLDDDPRKRGKHLNGLKVLGDRHHLKILAKLYKIQEVLVAMPSATPAELLSVIETCRQLGLKPHLFQSYVMDCNNLSQSFTQRDIFGENPAASSLTPSLNFFHR